MNAIVFQNIVKCYGDFFALNNLSFEVKQGEFFALLGPNGAGKTTLISILGGLTRANSGKVSIMGHDVIRDYRLARQSVGIVPQEVAYDPFFSVRETLTFQSGYFGILKNAVWINELLENLGLVDKANANMRSLSGGMQRRVMIAQALVHRPPVIVLDEPTAGVDVTLRQTLWAFFQRLNQQGHTIVLTTHYLEEAQTLCNRVAVLKQGQLIALENTQTLLNRGKARTLFLKLNTDQLPTELMPLVLSAHSGGFELALRDPDMLVDLLSILRKNGVHLHDVTVNQPTLEDVFVEMTTNTGWISSSGTGGPVGRAHGALLRE